MGADAGHGLEKLTRYCGGEDIERPSFAPPILKAGKQVIGQTPAILSYLGRRHNLAPKNKAGRLWVHQLQLTILDLANEAHDIHHPISARLYYEEQKSAAKRSAAIFVKERIPKYLGYLDTIIEKNKKASGYLVGDEASYADLSSFQILSGLRYGVVTLLNDRAVNWHRTQAQAVAVAVAVCHRLIAWLRNWRNVFREIR